MYCSMVVNKGFTAMPLQSNATTANNHNSSPTTNMNTGHATTINHPIRRNFISNRKMPSEQSTCDKTANNVLGGNAAIADQLLTGPLALKTVPRGIVTTTSQLQTNSQTSTRVKSSSSSSTRLHVTSSLSSSSTSSSSSSASDLKASNMKSDLVELQNNLNDMKSSMSSIGLKQFRSSLENLVDQDAGGGSLVVVTEMQEEDEDKADSIRSKRAASHQEGIRHAIVSDKQMDLRRNSGSTKSKQKELMDAGIVVVGPGGGGGGGDSGGSSNSSLLGEPLVTFPDDSISSVANCGSESCSSINTASSNASTAIDTLTFEQKTMNNFKKMKVVKEGFSAEKESAKCAEMKILQAGDLSFEENSATASMRARLEMDGVSAEKNLLKTAEGRTLKSTDLCQQELKNLAHANMKITSDQFSSEQTAMESQQQQRQRVTSSTGIFNREKHSSTTSHSVYTTTKKGISTSSSTTSSLCSSSLLSQQAAAASSMSSKGQFQTKNVCAAITTKEDELLSMSCDDLAKLTVGSSAADIEQAISKYASYVDQSIKCLQKPGGNTSTSTRLLNKIYEVLQKAWAVPTHGHELGYSLCNTLRSSGGLDLLISNCVRHDKEMQFSSAQLLEQCLTNENRAYVVDHGLDKVVHVACVCTKNANSVAHSRVGTGILEHLFKHSEETCSDVVRLGGLDALLFECRKCDIDTLRHCAGALANLSLYGGAENQEAMIKRKVPMWLFPLAFHNDDNIKYYACLAITVLVANAEIEADVLQSGTLGLVEPFVLSHNPSEFATSNLAHAHGQSKAWLKQLVPVLSSKREEARNLAAFHFCMEAGIKKQQGNTNIFAEIGAVDSLKRVASSPNAVASKFAAQALRLIGEELPHKLSQQVPLWSSEDVAEWVKQIGFGECVASFVESRVDGDLLLQLTETNLCEDIGLVNGIKRKRFTRELKKLKKMADYTSRDSANINHFLQLLGPDYSIYTYSLLNAGVETKEALRNISEDQLVNECGIDNSIHRFRIMEGIRQLENGLASFSEDSADKSLDVFVSYRRSNGSQLASLLKVHLQLRGFTVFIDVERLEAGKFDNNLLQSIKKAKHFLLVLTPDALERCLGDDERKDWVHREIVAALQANCNIIPIIDNFQWPEAEELPEDMRQVCHFNGVRWIHDYQDACVDKLERFMRGELNSRGTEGGPINRLAGVLPLCKGDMTPGTPSSCALSSRQAPNYQRMHSNDSGSGKTTSDKDSNGSTLPITRD